MHENSGNSIIFYWHYTTDGVSTAGLTVTADVYEVTRDGTATLVVDDGACTDVGAGIYRYLLASGTVDAAAEYIAVAHTATDTVDAQDIPAMWVIDRAGTEKLDTGITLADDAITAAKFDESTAFPLKSADTGATQVARVGADSDTLETLSDQLDLTATASALATAQADLDNPTQYKADVSGIPAAVWGYATRTLSSFGTLVADIWSNVTRTLTAFGFTVATNSDANVTAIKAKTDLIPAAPAQAGEYTAAIAAVQADLDNPDQYKADVSAITGASLSAAGVDAILDEVVVGTYTLRQLVKVMAAALAGKATGGDTTTVTFRGVDDASDVIVATVDANGNRSEVVLTV